MRFSIITVCFNSEKTIERTLISVLNQDYTDYEYIIIDGNSNDHTIEIINKYKKRFCNRLQIISETDDGIYDAMNKGIRMAKGDWIGIINSDDWYESNALRLVDGATKNMDKNQPAVAYGLCRIIDESGKLNMVILRTENELLKGVSMLHPSAFINRAAYSQVGVYSTDYPYCADYDLFLRMKSKGTVFMPIEEILANFTEGGVTGSLKSVIDDLRVRKSHGLISGLEYNLRVILAKVRNKRGRRNVPK